MDCWPHSVVVDMGANRVTMLVICLTGNIHALCSATLGEKFLLGVLVQEDVDEAFDFLGCRPIDLAVLLKALLLLDELRVSTPAAFLALLEFDSACSFVATALSAQALLKFLLSCIADHVNCEEIMVVCLALCMILQPSVVSAREVADHLLNPASVCSRAITKLSNTDLIIAALLVASHEVWAETFFVWAWEVLPVEDEATELTAALAHLDIRFVHFSSTFHVSLVVTFTLIGHADASCCGLLVGVDASHKAQFCVAVQVLLVNLVLLHECGLDVPHKDFADGFQRIANVLIKFPSRHLNRLVSQALHQGLHVRDITVSNSSKKVLCC